MANPTYNVLDLISPGLREELDLRPLKEDEVIEYRHIRANIEDRSTVDQDGKYKMSTPAAHSLAPRANIKDPHNNNRTIQIMNIVAYDSMPDRDGLPVLKPRPDYFRFPSTGSVFISSGGEDQFYFARLHDKNVSKPRRDTSKGSVFREIDEKKEISLAKNIFEYRSMAGNMIMEADENDDELITMAAKIAKEHRGLIHYDPNKMDQVKAGLITVAHSYPIEFITAQKQPKSYTKLIVDDAIARRKVFFNDNTEKLSWNLKRELGKKTSVQICKINSERGKLRELVEFLLTPEGSAIQAELRSDFEANYLKSR